MIKEIQLHNVPPGQLREIIHTIGTENVTLRARLQARELAYQQLDRKYNAVFASILGYLRRPRRGWPYVQWPSRRPVPEFDTLIIPLSLAQADVRGWELTFAVNAEHNEIRLTCKRAPTGTPTDGTPAESQKVIE
jgi:hypothetical protein